jgi:ribosomal protein L10
MANPRASGVASTRTGKALLIDRVKKILTNTTFITSFSIEGVTKEQIDSLRKELPEGVTASVVKNSIMRLVTNTTHFAPIGDIAKNESMYVFIPEGSSIGTYQKLTKWFKDIKVPEVDRSLKAVVLDGNIHYGNDLIQYINLPSKVEMIGRLMRTLQSVGERLVLTLKSLATSKEEEEKQAGGPSAVDAALETTASVVAAAPTAIPVDAVPLSAAIPSAASASPTPPS